MAGKEHDAPMRLQAMIKPKVPSLINFPKDMVLSSAIDRKSWCDQ
jgi:hypothetical protein